MIVGLKYHFTSDELCNHMLGRAQYHERRAAEKEEALPKLRAAVEQIKSTAPAQSIVQISKTSNYDMGNPDKDLESDIKAHKNKALVFRTLAEHVVEKEVYELTEQDLIRIEILKVDY